MTRRQRITLELLGPPLVGGALATLWAWGTVTCQSLQNSGSIWTALDMVQVIPAMWLLYGLFAFPMIGIQAVCYAAILEWRFARGLDPRSGRAVALSTFLGWMAGFPLALGYGFARKDTWWLFNVLGPAVGLILGLAIRRLSAGSPRAAARGEQLRGAPNGS